MSVALVSPLREQDQELVAGGARLCGGSSRCLALIRIDPAKS
jgi:hypothetical protein